MSEEEHDTCQACGKKPATVHLTDFVDGKPVAHDLCDECYAARGDAPSLNASPELVAQIFGMLAPELKDMAEQSCPDCGMTYLEFRQNLRFGCPGDYGAFREPLDELLDRIHGAHRHIGSVPTGAAQHRTLDARIAVLKRRLQRAIEREDFERAAEICERIKQWEQ